MKLFAHLLVIALAASLLIGSAHALTLDERSLANLSFPGIEITQPNQTSCQTIAFEPFEDYQVAGNDTLLSFHTDFIPLSEADANILITSADESLIAQPPIALLQPRDLLANGNAHVLIPADYQREPLTHIRICATSSPSTESLRISHEGTLGLYHEPRFDGENNFQTRIAGENPQLGEEIPIQVTLTNTGREPASVDIKYRKYDLDYIPLLKGETGFEGVIQPGETKTITYLIKPLRAVSILLPPAVLTYTNIFGEEIVQESTRAYLNVEGPEFNVNGAFLVPQTQANVNEPLTVRWVAKNEGIAPISGLVAQFTVAPHGTISPTQVNVDALSPSAAASREFTLTFSEPGTYTIGCRLTTSHDPTLTTNCQSATIEVVENSAHITLLFSLVLLVIAIGVYAYIAYGPTRKSAPEPPKKRRFQAD